MIKVGLTGNIGSGKSTVSRVFETLGVPVYHADSEAKKFLDDESVQDSLIREFGSKIFEDRIINRKKLARLVFNDKQALEFLNSLIHPLVRKDFETWTTVNPEAPYIIQEAAILFESGFYKMFDKVITVASLQELAVARVMVRDGVSEKDVLLRMNNQWSSEKKEELSDYVVYNDGSKLIIPQVLEIHRRLIELDKLL
jgi:dephospho-CoA kinase